MVDMETVERFLNFVKNDTEVKLSNNTLDALKGDLNQFLDYLKEQQLQYNKESILSFKQYLQSKCKGSTVNRKLSSIRKFVDYCNEYENLEIKGKVKLVKTAPKFLVSSLTNSDVTRLLRAMDKALDVRARAMLLTLAYTGCRVSEMLQIKITDVKSDKIEITGKGDKPRFIYIPKKLKSVWKQYLEVKKDDKLLFPVTRVTVGNILKHYAGQARIKLDKVHPHALRHLFAINIAESNLNKSILKQLLGHALDVTDLYLAIGEKQLLTVINQINYV